MSYTKDAIERQIDEYNTLRKEIKDANNDYLNTGRDLNDTNRQLIEAKNKAQQEYLKEQENARLEYVKSNADAEFNRGHEAKRFLTENDDVTDALDLEMTTHFNDNYDKVQKLNSEISTKDRLIYANNMANRQKENTIYVLKNIIFLVLLITVFVAANLKGKLSTTWTIVLIIALIIIDAIIIYRHLHYRSYEIMVYELKNDTVGSKKYQEYEKNKKCASRCRTRDNPNIYDYNLNRAGIKTMDSQNVWSDGNEPWYPKPSEESGVVTYTCKWIGDPSAVENNVIVGTRPCKYYIGYEEIANSITDSKSE